MHTKMINKVLNTTWIMASILLMGCNQKQEDPSSAHHSSDDKRYEQIKKGKGLTQKAFKALSSQLKASIRQNGVAQSIHVCSDIAYPLTDSIGKSNEVTLRRVTDRYRNPKNKASEKDLEILQMFKTNTEKVFHYEQNTFYKPIKIQPLCLNCHGKNISKQTQSALEEVYPKDKATGYDLNNLRGMWVVKFSE